MELLLVTGFLGAGKTTFLRRLLSLWKDRRLALIINEFGQANIDGKLLSVFCSCRMDQFEKTLRESADINADVILVEASGLSDPTGVHKLFSQTERFPHIEYCGAVCLVDAIRFPKLYTTARSCMKQLASSDVAVVNKTERASKEQLSETLSLLNGQRPDMPVIQTAFGAIDESILDTLAKAHLSLKSDMPLTADLTLKKLMITVSPSITPYDLQKFIEMFSEATFRVKGFVQTSEGLHLTDCVGNVVNLTPYNKEIPKERIGHLVVLSGAGMPVNKYVKEACRWYQDRILSLE